MRSDNLLTDDTPVRSIQQKKQDRNLAGMIDLPDELLVLIFDEVRSKCDSSLRRLSLTCTRLFQLLKHSWYKEAALSLQSHPTRDLVNAAGVACGPRSNLVKRLMYAPDDPLRNIHRGYPPVKKEEEVLTGPIRTILESLGPSFPELHYVELDTSIWNNVFTPDRLNRDRNLHPDQRSPIARAPIEQALAALCQSAGDFMSLSLNRLPPLNYSVFRTAAWTSLLSGLDELDVTLSNAHTDNGDTCDSHVLNYHHRFLLYFATHVLGASPGDKTRPSCIKLPDLTKLCIRGSSGAFICGENGHGPHTIEWAHVSLPQLEHFELEYGLLGNGIDTFLRAHARTLKTVKLLYCFAAKRKDWGAVFQDIIRMGDTGMRGNGCLIKFEATQAMPFLLDISTRDAPDHLRHLNDFNDLDPDSEQDDDDSDSDPGDYKTCNPAFLPKEFPWYTFYPCEVLSNGILSGNHTRDFQPYGEDEEDEESLCLKSKAIQEMVKRNRLAQKI